MTETNKRPELKVLDFPKAGPPTPLHEMLQRMVDMIAKGDDPDVAKATSAVVILRDEDDDGSVICVGHKVPSCADLCFLFERLKLQTILKDE